jgi:hypothetical protein
MGQAPRIRIAPQIANEGAFMNARRSTLAFTILIASWTLSGCVANRSYRRGGEVQPPELPRSVDGTQPSEADCSASPAAPLGTQPPHYYLAHIEFDDMGELWSIGSLKGKDGNAQSQLDKALEVIRTAQKLANDDKRELVVIAFVHGWHNNSSKYDEIHKNLGGFETMMQTLSCWSTDEVREHPVLVGIFLSWRGQSLRGDPALTYWNRRDAATRVGGPSMTEVVTRLMFETKGAPLAPNPDADCEVPPVDGKEMSHFAIIAHSFGARALEHALTQPMLSMVLEREAQARECARARITRDPGGKPLNDLTFPAPADLIVFLNAANDAFEAKETIEALKRSKVRVNRKGADRDRLGSADTSAPFMISITSDGDWATERVMPIAQWFSSLALSFRPYDQAQCKADGQLCGRSQRYYYRHSEASVGEMRSHLVILYGDAKSCGPEPDWPYFKVEGKNRCFCIDHSGGETKEKDECGIDKETRKSKFGTDEGWNNTPFYVMGVPKELIKDHNDIFQDGTAELLTTISSRYEILVNAKGPATMTIPTANKQ